MNHKSNAFNHTNIKQQHFFITFASLIGKRATLCIAKNVYVEAM